MKKISNFLNLGKDVFVFGQFKGLSISLNFDSFDEYKKIKNKISKAKIIKHIESLQPLCLCPTPAFDMFTNERLLSPGYYKDGDFVFPIEFLHYYKKYDIGVPKEYEEYIKTVRGI